jgi:vesicle coat complex subunit
VVYLYLVNYGKSRPEEIMGAINGFLSVSCPSPSEEEEADE